MDLRPRLADAFLTAILEDLRAHGLGDDEHLRERWRPLILDRFVSHSLPMPSGRYTGTYQPDVVDAFIAKYPEVEPIIEYLRFVLREIWPDVRILVEVNSDPEGCHLCREGQSLSVEYFSQIADAEDDAHLKTSEADALADWTWSPLVVRERKCEDLVFNEGLYAEAPQEIRDLVRLSRGYGDPDELLAGEAALAVEWERRRRERAGLP